MRLPIAVFPIVLAAASHVLAFTPSGISPRSSLLILKNMAEDVGIPCEDECALNSYPKLPPSVHPGVLSGQAMMDLLQHAKDNGEQEQNSQNCLAR